MLTFNTIQFYSIILGVQSRYLIDNKLLRVETTEAHWKTALLKYQLDLLYDLK
jgi:hypothetical protein